MMEQILLIALGILGVGISVVVKMIFLCMDTEGPATPDEAAPERPRASQRRRRHAATRRRRP